jgi:hypothetical protein
VVDDRKQHDLLIFSVAGRVDRNTARCILRKSLIGPTPRRASRPPPAPLFRRRNHRRQFEPLSHRHELLAMRQPGHRAQPTLRHLRARFARLQLLDPFEDGWMKAQQSQDVADVHGAEVGAFR